MAEAGTEGILLGDYIKRYEQPETYVRGQLDCGELRYTWKDNDGNERASDDGGELPPKGWWTLPSTKIDHEQHSVQGRRYPPFFPPMSFVRIHPTVAPKAKAKGQRGTKFDLVLDILADLDQPGGRLASNLLPAQIEKKVLPVFRRRWAELKPDDDTEPPVERTTINRAYQSFLEGDRSGK